MTRSNLSRRAAVCAASFAALALAGFGGAAFAQGPDAGPGRAAQAGPDGALRDGPRGGGRAERIPHRALELFRAADLDGDGGVTRAELRALKDEMFSWLDRNADGTLDLADRSPVEQRLAALAPPEGAEGRSRGRPGDEPRAMTRAEFLDEETPLFDRLDADADGAVTGVEVEAFVGRIAMMSRWARGR